MPGSPAINAGDNATCLATDQRGIARPQQGQCDIGAFESRGFTLTRSSGNNQSTPIGMTFPAPLVVSVSSSTGEPVSGGVVTLTGPGSGAGTSPVSTTAVISGSIASASLTANAIAGGPYTVAANSTGASPVNFSLTNLKGTPVVTVTSSLNPSTVGQAVTLAATVSYTVGTPSGTVTFVIDGTPQTPVALIGGQASLTTSSLTVGNHTVSANYGGDANFNASSGSLPGGQTVNGTDAPTIQFTQAVYTTPENIGLSQNVILTRTGSLTNASQVQVSLSGGTATAGSDYSSAGFPQTITFGSGVVSQTVPIAITDDGAVEPTETISLTLTPLVNAVVGAQNSAVLHIQDNDVAPAPESKVYLPLLVK